MELLVFPAFLLFAMFCIGMKNRADNMKQLPAPKPVQRQVRSKISTIAEQQAEEPIGNVIKRIKERKRADTKKAMQDWDRDFFKSEKLENHPDFFVPSEDDEMEITVIRSPDGNILRKIKSYTTPTGQQYGASIDKVTRKVRIHTNGTYWDVDLDDHPYLI